MDQKLDQGFGAPQQNRNTGLPWKRGLGFGLLAWFISLGIFILLGQVLLSGSFTGMIAAGLPIITGAVFLIGTHVWPIFIFTGSPSAAIIFLIFSILPMAVLLFTGYKVSSGSMSNAGGFKQGTTLASGYFLGFLITFTYILIRVGSIISSLSSAFGGTTTTSYSYGSATTTTTSSGGGIEGILMFLLIVVFVGIVYPAIFAGLGGKLGS